MPKKVVSVSLSKESIKRLEGVSRALGMSRSELLEYMIQKGWNFSEELESIVDTIMDLQDKVKIKFEEDQNEK